MIQEEFFKVAQHSHFFDKHQKVLVAVSGGKDSMNLLHLLYQHRKVLAIELGIAHINHGQRPESQMEEEAIRQLAQQLELPFYCAHFTDTFSEKKARDFRYAFFTEVMDSEGYTALTTAHHIDDQAETILMRLIRSSRLRHLSGIQAVRPFGPGELIRPLLTFRKSDLADYPYFEDASNQELDVLRNRVRHIFLPALTQENPKFSEGLVHLGHEVSLYQEAFKELTQELDICSVATFQQYSRAVQTLLLENYLDNFPDLQIGKKQFQEVLAILNHKANYQHPLKNGYVLFKDYQRFEISKIRPEMDDQSQSLVVEFDTVLTTDEMEIGFGVPIADYDQVIFVLKNHPVIIRKRKEGDRILLNGIHKKLRRYFIDHKISRVVRESRIVLEQDQQIYGLANIVSGDLSKQLKNDIMKAELYIKMKE